MTVDHDSRAGTVPPDTTPVVQVDSLVVEYAKPGLGRRTGVMRAVDQVDLSVPAGRTLGIVGESGSGKTSVARAVTRMIRPAGGSIRWLGTDVSDLSERQIRPLRRHLQMVFQDPYSSLNPRQTVAEILREPLRAHQVGVRSEQDDRITDMIDAVGLVRESAARYPHEFSGGQRQRIAIARALIVEPDAVICDEAVSSLDVSVQAQILSLLAALQRDRGVAYAFIAHDLAVVAAIAHDVVVMYGGAVVERGRPGDVLHTPRHPYTMGLISSVPSIRMRGSAAELDRFAMIDESEESDDQADQGCPFRARCWLRRELGDPQACTQSRPSLEAVEGGGSHSVACHFPAPALSVVPAEPPAHEPSA